MRKGGYNYCTLKVTVVEEEGGTTAEGGSLLKVH